MKKFHSSFSSDLSVSYSPSDIRFSNNFLPDHSSAEISQFTYESIKSLIRSKKVIVKQKKKILQFDSVNGEFLTIKTYRNTLKTGTFSKKDDQTKRLSVQKNNPIINKKLNPKDLINKIRNSILLIKELEENFNKTGKRKNGIFWRYHIDYSISLNMTCFNLCPKGYWKKEPSSEFLITFEDLQMALWKWEPFFCSIALYDLSSKIRISEYFSCIFSNNEIRKSIDSKKNSDILNCRSGIFSCDPSPDIVLVVHIQRILQGTPENALNLYAQDKKLEQNTENISKMHTMIEKLKDYKQELAWGFIHIFDEYGSIINNKEDNCFTEFKISNLNYKKSSTNEEDFIKLLYDCVKNQSSLKKQKKFPKSLFKFKIRNLNDGKYPIFRVDPSLFPLKRSKKILDIKETVKEVERFPFKIDYIPNIHYINSLYVYPELILSPKHRNVCCKMQYRVSDKRVHQDGTRIIFGSNQESEFVSCTSTPVYWHSKLPKFHNEWKIMLPLVLSKTAHLFFTFYNVNCKESSSKNPAEEIGFAYKLISKDGIRLIENGDYTLNIYSKLGDEYLSKNNEKKTMKRLPFRMTTSFSFKIRLSLNSTIHCQDENLGQIFLPITINNKTKQLELMNKRLELMKNINIDSLIFFLQPIIYYLMKLIGTNKNIIRMIAIKSIVIAIDRVSNNRKIGNKDQSTKCGFAEIWVDNVFENIGGFVYYVIALEENTKILTEVINDNFDNKNRLYLEQIWFWFKVSIKSMQLEIVEMNKSGKVVKLSLFNEFIFTIYKFIEEFIQVLLGLKLGFGLTILRKANKYFAEFVTELFWTIDDESVIDIAKFYDKKFEVNDDPNLLNFKIDFFHYFFNSEFILNIINKSEYKIIKNDPINSIIATSPVTNFIISFAITNIKVSDNNYASLDILRNILTKHDYDYVNKTEENIIKITSKYFPLALKFLDDSSIIMDSNSINCKNSIICFFWVLRNCEKILLDQIWKREIKSLRILLKIIKKAIVMFDFSEGKKSMHKFESTLSAESTSLLSKTMLKPVSDIKSDLESLFHKNINSKQKTYSTRNERTLSKSKDSFTKKYNLNLRGERTLREKRVFEQEKVQSFYKKSLRNFNADHFSKDEINTIKKREGELTEVVFSTIFYLIFNFIKNNMTKIDKFNSEILYIFIKSLSANLTDELYLQLYEIVIYLLNESKNNFKFYNNLQIKNLISHFFNHSTFPNEDIRGMCAKLIYKIAKKNYQDNGNLDVFYLTVIEGFAGNKWIISLSIQEIYNIKQVIDSLIYIADMDKDWKGQTKEGKTFIDLFKSVHDKLGKLLNQFVKLVEINNSEIKDTHLYEDIIVYIAYSYSELPKIKILWLNMLSEYHKKIKNYAEAGECYGRISDIFEKDLIGKEKSSESNSLYYMELKNNLELACEMFIKATLYERCDQIYSRLLPLFKAKKEYDKVSKAHLKLHEIFDELYKLKRNVKRFLGSFYLVGFEGKCFGSLNNKQFIYKFTNLTRLESVSLSMKEKYEKETNKKINFYSSKRPKDIGSDEGLLKIVYLDDACSGINTVFETETVKQKFKYSSIFFMKGKEKEYNHKRVIFLIPAEPFPSIKTRLEIDKSYEEILEPIKAATEDIELRIQKFYKCLNTQPIDYKILAGLLTGSIMQQVNKGILDICKTFLGENKGNYKKEDVEKLIHNVKNFKVVCRLGIEKFKAYSLKQEADSQIQMLNNELQIQFEIMKKDIDKCLI